ILGACGSLGAECRVARHVMGRPGAQTEVAPATGLVQQGALRTSAGASERTTAVGCFDILPALKKGRGFLRSLVWFQPEHFRRVPVSSIGLTAPHLRRLHIGPARP